MELAPPASVNWLTTCPQPLSAAAYQAPLRLGVAAGPGVMYCMISAPLRAPMLQANNRRSASSRVTVALPITVRSTVKGVPGRLVKR